MGKGKNMCAIAFHCDAGYMFVVSFHVCLMIVVQR